MKPAKPIEADLWGDPQKQLEKMLVAIMDNDIDTAQARLFALCRIRRQHPGIKADLTAALDWFRKEHNPYRLLGGAR
jgi:hypothetical protein